MRWMHAAAASALGELLVACSHPTPATRQTTSASIERPAPESVPPDPMAADTLSDHDASVPPTSASLEATTAASQSPPPGVAAENDEVVELVVRRLVRSESARVRRVVRAYCVGFMRSDPAPSLLARFANDSVPFRTLGACEVNENGVYLQPPTDTGSGEYIRAAFVAVDEPRHTGVDAIEVSGGDAPGGNLPEQRAVFHLARHDGHWSISSVTRR